MGEGITPVDQSISADFSFKSTLRTQEITLEKCFYRTDDVSFNVAKSKKVYKIEKDGKNTGVLLNRRNGFLFDTYYQGKVILKSSAMADMFVFQQFQKGIEMELQKTLYLGPFRQSPLRKYQTHNSYPTEVGSEGEAAVTILANEHVRSSSKTLTTCVSRWFQELGLANSIKVSRLPSSDMFHLSVKLPDNVELPIADLGYGMSQVLPVLVQCANAEVGSTLLFEQPEIHLHQGAASKLGNVFIETAKQKNCHIIIETHSPELFKQIFSKLRNGDIAPEDFIAYKVQRVGSSSIIEPVEIVEEDGDFDIYDPWEKILK